MTIELDENIYIVGMWFSSDPISGNDWLATIIRDPDHPTRYKGSYRFRYIKDDKIFDSEDEKSWTDFTCEDNIPETQIIEGMAYLQEAISAGYPDMDKIIVQDGIDKFFELAEGKPWMNIKQEKPEEERGTPVS